MDVKGKQYIWKTNNESTFVRYHQSLRRFEVVSHPLQLQSVDGDQGEPSAKITRIPQGVLLEITTSAIQTGLLDITVVTAVLLHSGRRFD
jgi:hypothetical protein